ncbi:MAG TPA: dehydrogenase E1 component subunit alpha/beta [Trebonia sp.]|nr:dehydrogenase E1 component subunit alpha/beta [Trebonia sp.]
MRATTVQEAAQSPELPTDSLLEAYGRMTLIRVFEERVSELYRTGEVPGFVHLSIGQEASAVGACWPLATADVITSNHRGHGHCLAKGLPPEPMMAELLARVTGTNKGLGGSMHIADPELGIFGANGIVAAGVPIAGGAALAAQLRGRDGQGQRGVVVSFFGDGAVAQGAFHEAANLAALWRLPIVFFCENNGYAEFSPIADQHPVPMAARAAGYGLEYVSVDGNDVEAVAVTMTDVVRRVREGAGPVFVEAATYRWHGHYEGDPEKYRSKDELSEWQLRDPLVITRARLLGRGVGQSVLDQVEAQVRARIEAAVDTARQAPQPDMGVLRSSVYAPRPPAAEPGWQPSPDSEVFRTMDAVRLALEGELDANPGMFVAGVDVGKGGNVFALTRGLHAKWPGRLLDTPISETAVMGLAVGGAMAGMTPVVELMYLDFLGVCFDQILNQAAKLRFMTGGKARMGLVIRTQFGGGRSSGSQHSQSLEALLAHVPGLTVVMPSTPADTYGLLRSAIRDQNPVVFIENRQLYGMKGPKPPADYLLPLGKAKVVRQGTDVTVVSVSRMVHEAVAAAESLAQRGISAEVIDLRTVAPLDKETILTSLSKTSRLLIAHEGVTDFGIGAEIAALAVYEGFWTLDAPVMRVAPPPTPSPYAPNLEQQWLPGRQAIERAAAALVRV